jgi:hypothetical protein
LRRRIKARCGFATPMLAGTGAGLMRAMILGLALINLSPSALGQPADGPGAPPAVPAPSPAPSPDRGVAPAEAIRAFNRAEAWVRALDVAGPAEGQAPAFTGAFVTLRLAGEIVGRGWALVDPAADAPSDPLREAASRAIKEARARMPVQRGLMEEEQLRAQARELTLSLELAGPLVPIEPMSFAEADLTLAPGLDGIAVRIGEKLEAVFPASMLAAGQMPGQALATAQGRASGNVALALTENRDAQPAAVREKLGARMFRFRVTHLVQSAPTKTPTFTLRGGRLIAQEEINTQGLRASAAMLAEHLVRRVGQSPAGDASSLGVLNPVTGEVAPSQRGPFERSIVAFALARHGKTSVAQKILEGLALPGAEQPAWDAPTLAMYLGAVAELTPAGTSAPAELRAGVARAQSELAKLVGERGALAGVPEPMWGLVAWGLARGDRLTGARVAEPSVRWVFANTPEARLVAHMPFLAWADEDVRGDSEGASAAMTTVRDALEAFQLRPEDAGLDGPDLAGGIVFVRARMPLPTSQSARGLAMMAWALRQERLTPAGEAPRRLLRVLEGARFIRQLTADESVAWMYASRERALGGLRAAAWDQKIGVEATAMGLIALDETLRSLEALAARR